MAKLEELVVWQRAVAFATDVYSATKSFPSDERFGLTSQIRRAAVSVPSNIAEGYGRYHDDDFKKFLRISCGSLYELRTQLLIARNTGMLPESDFDRLMSEALEIERMLNGFIRTLESRKNP